jgi:hypothetical protein
MKKKRAKRSSTDADTDLAPGMQKTHEISKVQNPNETVDQPGTDRWGDTEAPERENADGVFTPSELVQEEGEGDRQNDQLAALENIQPDINLDDPTK